MKTQGKIYNVWRLPNNEKVYGMSFFFGRVKYYSLATIQRIGNETGSDAIERLTRELLNKPVQVYIHGRATLCRIEVDILDSIARQGQA